MYCVLPVVHGDVELACLATWKDGSEMYLYGRMTGANVNNDNDDDDGFRCFVRDAFSVVVSCTAVNNVFK